MCGVRDVCILGRKLWFVVLCGGKEGREVLLCFSCVFAVEQKVKDSIPTRGKNGEAHQGKGRKETKHDFK